MYFSPSGFSRIADPASITTWYWFNCVYNVETCRCPKASYSVSSICCDVIPNRDAVFRSITSDGLQTLVLLVGIHVGQLR